MSGTIPKRAIKIPQINSDPHVIPYRIGFDPSAMGSDLEVTVHTSQDMSILVLDNARSSGEATDDQDKQWYMHMHVDNSDDSVVQKDTPTGGPASSSNIDPFPTPVNVQTDFGKKIQSQQSPWKNDQRTSVGVLSRST